MKIIKSKKKNNLKKSHISPTLSPIKFVRKFTTDTVSCPFKCPCLRCFTITSCVNWGDAVCLHVKIKVHHFSGSVNVIWRRSETSKHLGCKLPEEFIYLNLFFTQDVCENKVNQSKPCAFLVRRKLHCWTMGGTVAPSSSDFTHLQLIYT